MAKSQETFSKKEKEEKRRKKKEKKQQRKEERQANSGGGGLDQMMAYVDEYGNITDTPPDPTRKKETIDASSIEIGVPKKEDEPEEAERKGRVAFFNDSKGYGFINDERGGDRYFVHVSGVLEPIAEGDKVTYELEQGKKGLNAVRVKKI